MIIINPGTEPNEMATEKNAIKIVKYIEKDLGLSGKNWRRGDKNKDKNGWFNFIFSGAGGEIEVDIPGDNPEEVVEGKPLLSRRLYVDGSSWLYGYALDFIFNGIKKEIV